MKSKLFLCATLLALLVSCTKKEGPASEAGLITPSFLSLSYGQEARISANTASAQTLWVVSGTGDEGAPVQIISQGPEGDNATFVIVKAIAQNGSGSVQLMSLQDYSTLASCAVTVNTIQIKDVELEQNSVSLVLQPKVGESKTYQIQATVKPDNVTFRELSYESENPAVASVDDYGLITAVSEGETMVFVRTQDGSDISKEIIVRVVPSVEKPNAVAFETVGDVKYLPDIQVGKKQTVNLLWHPLNVTEKSYTLTFEPEGYVRVVEQTEDYFVIKALRSGRVLVGLKSPYYQIKDDARYTLNIQSGDPYLEWDWTGLEQYINDFSGTNYLMLSYNETPKVRLKANAYNISAPSFQWGSNTDKLAFNPNGYFWVSEDASSTPNNFKVTVALPGNEASAITYWARYYKEPKLFYADNPYNNKAVTSIQLSASHPEQDVVFYVRWAEGENRAQCRQVMCYTLSNSISDYVRPERLAVTDDENQFRDYYCISRKKAPASKRTGTLTVWPLGYPKLTKTIDITVE